MLCFSYCSLIEYEPFTVRPVFYIFCLSRQSRARTLSVLLELNRVILGNLGPEEADKEEGPACRGTKPRLSSAALLAGSLWWCWSYSSPVREIR